MPLKKAIAEAINNRNLDFDAAYEAMNIIMSGEATQAQMGSYLTALRMKGETVDEIAGSAAAMREHVIRVTVPPGTDGHLYDLVGTGGDGSHTFNISTTSAFVCAAAGRKLAKHGNRSVSSRSGAADVLMSLGGNLEVNPEQNAQTINDTGIGFLYAVKHHPSMRHAIGPRRELGQRTIFNILGPLTNPAFADHVMVGVFAPHLTEPMARTLAKLQTEKAYVVHGADGLDELSVTGVNRVSCLRDGEVMTIELDPEEFGLPRASIEDLVGGNPDENAAITRGILSGEISGPKRDVVLLNAGALLGMKTLDFAGGIEEARATIDSGAALKTLDAWIAKTNSF